MTVHVPESALNRRMNARFDVEVRAVLRVNATLKVPVLVQDLSETGFRCECTHDFKLGQDVWLTMPNLTGFHAHVARKQGWMYGFQFDRPLYPAMLDHIAAIYRKANAGR